MIYPYNVHTHTIFSDGADTAEKMIEHAITKGFKVLGFSEHSFLPFADDWVMTKEKEAAYRAELPRLKEKYAGKIDVLMGIEQDLYSESIDFEYDYVIGSSHRMVKGEYAFENDSSYEKSTDMIEKCFNGSVRSYVEEYYELEARVPEVTKCDIIGHFDLITKFNENSRMFDENSMWYKDAAVFALEKVLSYGLPLEINTGGMYRKCRTVPYPSVFLLKEINARGGEIMINADAHDAASIGHYFDESAQIAKACGFGYLKALTSKGFENIKL